MNIKSFAIGTIVTISIMIGILGVFGAAPVSALSIQDGVNAAQGSSQPVDLFGSAGVFTSITNILLFIIGALSVVMIIIGGLRYVVSGGNATAVSGAKNTILYAIIGLVVAFLAYAAINFVLGSLTGANGGGTTI